MINIKVCGITDLKQIKQLDGLDIEFVGLNFYSSSPRYIGDKLSADGLRAGDFDIKKTGIFVDADYTEIMKQVKEYELDVVQLHGEEDPLLCEQLSAEVEVIKTFHIDNSKTSVDDMIADYDDVCDYYLFDTDVKSGIGGGTGIQFDWKKVTKAKIEKPFFLSGGIGPDDVAKLKAIKHPDFYGVDINSKFEKEPGVKDMVSILQFKQALRKK